MAAALSAVGASRRSRGRFASLLGKDGDVLVGVDGRGDRVPGDDARVRLRDDGAVGGHGVCLFCSSRRRTSHLFHMEGNRSAKVFHSDNKPRALFEQVFKVDYCLVGRISL